jgi:D-alanine-D-alanine ligase
MRIAVLYNQPAGGLADVDVLVQRDAVKDALTELGHDHVLMTCTLDLTRLAEELTNANIDCVFNLVESLGGTDRLAVLIPMLLEAHDIPYTGNDALATLSASDKVLVKQRLTEHGLPTPAWYSRNAGNAEDAPGRYIVKARFEHASIGLDDSAVTSVEGFTDLAAKIESRTDACGIEMFAEQFISGREFNISVMSKRSGGCQTLASAEIDFTGFPEDKPQIVGFDAKWTESSFEFNATPRRFCFPHEDSPLLAELARLTEVVWDQFGLSGYARVDYRIDRTGHPFILEINTNPCISPDAGFVAALQQDGISFADAIATFIDVAITRVHGRHE